MQTLTARQVWLFIALLAGALGWSCPQSFGAVAQQAYVKASNTGEFDEFGTTVAISTNLMVVGAPGESSNATGVNGSENNDSASSSGAAYIYVRSGVTWTKQAYLKASDSQSDFAFGSAVAIDGHTVVVGAPGASQASPGGAAYVFVWDGANWIQQARLKASNAGGKFGAAVSVSGDTVVVGAYEERSNGTGVNGSQTTYTSIGSGAAYIFKRIGTTWTQQAYLKASTPGAGDWFGYSVSVSAEGELVVVGAPEEDSSATGVNGNESNNNAPNSGAAYVFIIDPIENWSQAAYLKASHPGAGDNFGRSVSLTAKSIFTGTLVVGAPNEDSNATGVNGDPANDDAYDSGAAYVFSFTGIGIPVQEGYLKASNPDEEDAFGISVAAVGDTVVVGAREEDSNGPPDNNSSLNAGAAYVFSRSGTEWMPQSYLKASNPAAENQMYERTDLFGSSVGISGDTVVVGAPGEASNALNVDGNQDDNSLPFAGAAYVFLKTTGSFYSIPSPDSVIDFGTVPVSELALRKIHLGNNGPENLCILAIHLNAQSALTFAVARIGGGVVSLPYTIPPGSPSDGLELSLVWVPPSINDRPSPFVTVDYLNQDCNGVLDEPEQASYFVFGKAVDPLAVALEAAFLGWLYAGQPQGQAIRVAASPTVDAVQTVTLALDPSVPSSLTAQVPAFLGGGSVLLSNFTGSVTISLLSLPNDSERKIIRIDSGSLTAPSARLPSGLITGPNQLTFGLPEQSGGMLFLTNGSYTAYATATIVNNLIPDGVTVQGNYSGIYNAQTGGISLQSASRDLFEPSERVLLNYSPSGLWLTWANTNAVEQATDVTGPWRTVTNAVSPHLVMTTNSQQFFRLRLPAP